MKKFWTVLALLAVALNFSSARLWAEEIKTEVVPVVAAAADTIKEDSDEEVALETAALATDEKGTVEDVKSGVAQPAVVAGLEEDNKDEMGMVLSDTTQAEDKIS